MPDLSADTQEFFRCFTLCGSQLRAGFGGAYALDWAVVVRVADDMGLDTDESFYAMLRQCESAMLTTINKKPAAGREHG